MDRDLIYGTFSKKQKEVFNSLNEKVVDPAYDLLTDVDHVSFEDIEKAIPNISIDRLDWTKATKFSQPRSREEIQEWIGKSNAKWFSPFTANSIGRGKDYNDARGSLAAIAFYASIMLNGSEDTSNWCGDIE